MVIISTVLPGTLKRYIYPVMSKYINLTYNPFFIAMGTTIENFFIFRNDTFGNPKKQKLFKVSKVL